MSNISLFGGTGMIGQRVLREALSRGHKVTAIVRDPAKITEKNPNLTVIRGDIFKLESVLAAANGHDVLISAYSPPQGDPKQAISAVRA